MNPYKVLNISPGASEEVIKKAYRKAVKDCHPDTHPGDKAAEERFKVVAEAYAILSNDEKRQAYEANLTKEKVKKTTKEHSGYSNNICPRDFEREFEKFFSMGRECEPHVVKQKEKVNPIDVSELFEKYMGFKN